jgi:hypothetical protein
MKSFNLANQIWSHATAAKIWNKCESVWRIPIFSGLRIINNQSVIVVTFKARMLIGQKEWCHTTQAIGQKKNRSNRESVGKEHREQEVSRWDNGMEWNEKYVYLWRWYSKPFF